MVFSLHTLLALASSAALLLTIARMTGIGLILWFVAMPIAMMLIAITSPRNGNQLDPTNRWQLFLLAKVWALTLIGLLCFAAVVLAAEAWGIRVAHVTRGDAGAYSFAIPASGETEPKC